MTNHQNAINLLIRRQRRLHELGPLIETEIEALDSQIVDLVRPLKHDLEVAIVAKNQAAIHMTFQRITDLVTELHCQDRTNYEEIFQSDLLFDIFSVANNPILFNHVDLQNNFFRIFEFLTLTKNQRHIDAILAYGMMEFCFHTVLKELPFLKRVVMIAGNLADRNQKVIDACFENDFVGALLRLAPRHTDDGEFVVALGHFLGNVYREFPEKPGYESTVGSSEPRRPLSGVSNHQHLQRF